MAIDPLRRRTPLGPVAAELQRVCSGTRFSCREAPFGVMTDVRCAPTGLALVADTIGVQPPGVGETARAGASTILGLGPRWWMVDAPDGSPPLQGTTGVSAVEVSAQFACFLLEGTSVRDVLAHGTTVDLHPEHLASGRAVQTLLAKVRVVLARTGADDYRLWVHASYARHLAAWLMDASVEYR